MVGGGEEGRQGGVELYIYIGKLPSRPEATLRARGTATARTVPGFSDCMIRHETPFSV